jgi:5'-nucleotidase
VESSVAEADRPLLLLTNDDGIRSPGLRAAAKAVRDLGELLVVAPRQQQTGAGRAYLPPVEDALCEERLSLDGEEVLAYSLQASPAQAVLVGLQQLAPRRPCLVISGINYGENVGTGITISGTIGAVLEGASFGIPGLAVSLVTAKEYHYSLSEDIDLSAAAAFTRFFSKSLLTRSLPFDVDILKVDVPAEATPRTPWRVVRVSRQRYHYPLVRDDEPFPGLLPAPAGTRSAAEGVAQAQVAEARTGARRADLDYDTKVYLDTLEPDSDIYALCVEHIVAVAPLSLDLSSRVDLAELDRLLRSDAQV